MQPPKSRVDSIYKNLKAAGLVDVMHATVRKRPQERLNDSAAAPYSGSCCNRRHAAALISRALTPLSTLDQKSLDPEDYVHRIGRMAALAAGHIHSWDLTRLRRSELEYFTCWALIPTWDLPGFSYDEGRIIPGFPLNHQDNAFDVLLNKGAI